MAQATRPASCCDFKIAIICEREIETDVVKALFDRHWDSEGSSYGTAPGDPNVYYTGFISRHNVVLISILDTEKTNAAAAVFYCHVSFPNINFALVVGVCGAAPFVDGAENKIMLGDVIISDGLIQDDLKRRHPERFKHKESLLDSPSGPRVGIPPVLAELNSIHGRKILASKTASYLDKLQKESGLKAEYPGVQHDKLFEATYRHISEGTCEECDCSGQLVPRPGPDDGTPKPAVHFGWTMSLDTAIETGERRDEIVQRNGAIGFQMASVEAWNSFPCLVIKGACNYADGHRINVWQNYATATASAV
ncbi:hypothetical protein AK830_g254 [Neonectria ditissima]|uniref:Nucleoside phosphorylase domain-containing protein n=1 Tax=Neonectria ditissima TaxID=78410 RepID=A0A0P7BGY8_9HYPO|nr:hypothetical protein AK830_g254 [Neonectria ditissima]